MNMRPWLALLGWIVVCLGAGVLGAIATTPEIPTWYQSLNKPAWTPPDRVFGPVWTTLYLMMAVAAWRVQRSGEARQTAGALSLFALQLALNVAWSWIFFHLHAPGWAALEIIALALTLVATIGAFRRHAPLAAGLLLPYLAWVSYATALNIAIWKLNPTL